MSRNLLLAVLAAVALMGVASTASANLIIDVRIAGTTATSIDVVAGDVITFELWGTVTASAGTGKEGIVSIFGSLLKQNLSSALRGEFVTYSTVANGGTSSVVGTPSDWFNQFPNYGGGQALYDLNGDGDVDVGGTATLSSNVAAYIQLRDANYSNHLVDGYAPQLMMTFQYRVTDGVYETAGGSITEQSIAKIYFQQRPIAQTAVWYENGGTKSAATGTMQSGQYITLNFVPEPATLALLCAGGLMLMRPRRRRI
jgi:hypothetical protein